MTQETVKVKKRISNVALPLGIFHGPDMHRVAGGGLAHSRRPSIMSLFHV